MDILTAVLAGQPDLGKQRDTETSKERGYFDGLFDDRLCVDQISAGADGDFQQEYLQRPGFPPNPQTLSKKWEKSPRRFALADHIKLPPHLRWDEALAICTNGVIRLGNPMISGDRAQVYVENKCSGLCGGWGGEVLLHRTNGEWIIDKEINWWQG